MTDNTQSCLESWVEAIINTAIGFVISFLLWYPVAYIHGIEHTTAQSFTITTCFTLASLLRGYAIRRWCQAYLRRVIKNTTLFIQTLFRIKELDHNG